MTSNAAPTPERPPSNRWSRPAAYAGLLVAALFWTWYAQRDVNWDLLNYHVYAGYSVFNDRFSQDFFAAFPAYFTPYAHGLFYWLMASGLPSLAMAGVLATVHCSLLWLVYEMALVLVRGERPWRAQFIALTAALLALSNPVYLLELGTSFVDITTGIPVVAAWLALALSLTGERRTLVAVAGLLMGIGVGLKLSNSIFAVATMPVFLFLPVSSKRRLEDALTFGVLCTLAVAMVAGPWAMRLYQEFGNPFFPMFNGLFRSPDFAVEGAVMDRFLPRSLAEALSLPFRMALPLPMIHVETASPDLRYAALALVAGMWMLAGLCRPHEGEAEERPAPRPLRGNVNRLLGAMAVLFLASWVLWQLTSGNSRYFIPAASIAPILIVELTRRLVVRCRPAALVLICLGLVLLQGAQVALGAAPRFAPADWTKRWIEVRIPDRYLNEPYLYLTLDAQSLSFLAALLHPGSGFFNATGGYAFDPEGPGGARAKALIQRFEGRVRGLIILRTTTADGLYRVPDFRTSDRKLLPWGFKVDQSDCDSIGLEQGLHSFILTGFGEDARTFAGPILNCGLLPAADNDRLEQAAARRVVEPVFEHLEQACPNLFKPRGLRVEGGDGYWQKSYGATDITVYISNGVLSYYSAMRGGDPVILGPAAHWSKGPESIDCSRRTAPLFGGLLK